MNLLEKAAANQLKKTGEKKKMSIRGQCNNTYDVYAIPLKYLYYNDKNGRINTAYKKYSSIHGLLIPNAGDSEYNKIFEEFIYNSNSQAMDQTVLSFKEKAQQEPGVVLSDGRVIDGNRRLTALRIIEKEKNIPQEFNAIILPYDLKLENDEKIIKEIELDLQLGHERPVDYNPIERIFDVYNTIEVKKIMTVEEYKKASGAKNTKGINKDIRLAELILKFIEIVSPGENPIDKFYLARELNLDGPIEEIEKHISKINSENKEAIKEAVLVYLASNKAIDVQKDTTRIMRELKDNVIKDNERLEFFLNAVDDKVDEIMDLFKENPIQSASDLKTVIEKDVEVKNDMNLLLESTKKIINKGKRINERIKPLTMLEEIMEILLDIDLNDFSELTVNEKTQAREIIKGINDCLYKIKNGI
ncbi:hypothetical protein [Sneathia sanguinegens]|uniref:hypothetical protein n=1 Tax=Sneathia sanguinegens TaxID=40543 RepID=UPI0023F8A90C|nr:hypothetical protein [Sneathia sanguinegens]